MNIRLPAAIGAIVVLARLASSAPLNDAQRDALRKVLEPQHANYDPAEKMLRRPFSTPGYHTTLKGGFVHPTRESLRYAAACLDTGEAQLISRGQEIIRRVIALQDQDPKSRTYGIWSWYLEEPLEKMSPPDWNWADFCGRELLQVALHHRQDLPPDMLKLIDGSIHHAANSIRKRNVGPTYTNIAVLGTYVTLIAGQLYEDDELQEYGLDRLRRIFEYTMENEGGFAEYNSPTYTLVTLKALGQLRQDVNGAQAKLMVDNLYALAWLEMASHFHVPTRQWGGPHSRCYRTLLDKSTLALIQRGTEGRAGFGMVDAPVDLESYRVTLDCPKQYEPLFVSLEQPRTVVKTYSPGNRPIIGRTYLHPKYTIGSINRGDLWNQRRALLAYWGSAEKPAYLHVRFLHDGYDFSAAQFFSVQREGTVLAGVNFATDGGDTHVSLDRIRNATIKARDLRLRFEFGGAIDDVKLGVPAQSQDPASVAIGDLHINLHVPFAVMGESQGRWEIGREKATSHLDVVLYTGEEKSIDLSSLPQAAIGLLVRISEMREFVAIEHQVRDGRLSMSAQKLSLEIPIRPDTQKALQSAFRSSDQ